MQTLPQLTVKGRPWVDIFALPTENIRADGIKLPNVTKFGDPASTSWLGK